MGNAVMVPMSELQTMAEALAGSGLFGVKTPQQALAIMLVAQAQGIPAAQACVDFDIIQGKPAMTARAMLARFQQAGGIIKWIDYKDDVCEAAFSHPQCPDPIVIRWTMADAQRAGLTNKDNWRRYPRQMLSSRVMSEGVDRCYPAASGGFYPPEVVRDFSEKNITPTAGAAERVSEESRAYITDIAAQMKEWLDQGSVADAVATMDNAAFGADESVYLWTFFDSKQRSAMKKEQERIRKALAAPKITDAQRKRLEAMISEKKLDRDQWKKFCKDTFSKEHFSDLSPTEYEVVCQAVDETEPAPAPELSGSPAASSLPAEGDAPSAGLIDAAQLQAILSRMEMGGIPKARLTAKLAASGIKSIDQLPASKFDSVLAWIEQNEKVTP